MKTLIATLIACVLAAVLLSPLFHAKAAVSNDEFANAQVITLPYSGKTDKIETATKGANDPQDSCAKQGSAAGGYSVWFRFTLEQAGTVTANTSDGSLYYPTNDSLLSIYRDGSPLEEVACNDDVALDVKYAVVETVLTPGTYYIKVSNGSASPLQAPSSLHLTVTFSSVILPTVTPSLTPLPVTETPTPPTPTSTSSTPAEVEFVTNGGFEIGTGDNPLPDGWTGKNLSSDKRICNKPDKRVAFSGNCAFQFTGSTTEKSQLRQDLAGVQSGDQLLLSAALMSSYSVPGKLVFVKIRYNEPNTGVSQNGKDQIKLELNAPTQGYTVLSQTLTVAGTPTKFFIAVRFRGTNGKARIDAVSLKKIG